MRKILWELTKRCNLRCRHCYLHSELKSPFVEPPDELGTEECLEIVEQFDEANVLWEEVNPSADPISWRFSVI
jgi:MoaA/NifB/PqqE/SkfB family radical SAM enzyme